MISRRSLTDCLPLVIRQPPLERRLQLHVRILRSGGHLDERGAPQTGGKESSHGAGALWAQCRRVVRFSADRGLISGQICILRVDLGPNLHFEVNVGPSQMHSILRSISVHPKCTREGIPPHIATNVGLPSKKWLISGTLGRHAPISGGSEFSTATSGVRPLGARSHDRKADLGRTSRLGIDLGPQTTFTFFSVISGHHLKTAVISGQWSA